MAKENNDQCYNTSFKAEEEKWLYEQLFIDLAIANTNPTYQNGHGKKQDKKVTFADKEIVHTIFNLKEKKINSHKINKEELETNVDKLNRKRNSSEVEIQR